MASYSSPNRHITSPWVRARESLPTAATKAADHTLGDRIAADHAVPGTRADVWTREPGGRDDWDDEVTAFVIRQAR